MKKFVSLLVLLSVLIMSLTVSANSWFGAENTYLDPMNNALFEVVAPIKEGTSTTGQLISRRYILPETVEGESGKETSYKFYEVYTDGALGKYTENFSDIPDSEIDSIYEYWLEADMYFNDGYTEVYTMLDENMNPVQYAFANVDYKITYESQYVKNIYNIDYNLGYVVESGISRESKITDIVTNEEFWFKNCRFETFGNDGYSVMYLFNENSSFEGKPDSAYVVKLKRPAIVTVYLNGSKIIFDQLPVIDNGRTLVPLRAIFEKLGATVEWDGATNTVTATKDGTTVSLTINNTTAYKNGEPITLDVPAKIVGGRTLVPVRFVGDCFGAKVEWDGSMSKVSLSY